jgi:hypothetical protein
MTNFVQQIATRIDTDADAVDAALTNLGIDSVQAPSSRVDLRVRRIAFTGRKTLRDQDPVDVDFEWEFDEGLTAVTSEKNLRGKSTLLWLIRWGLTGERPELIPADVRAWIDRVQLDAEVDGTAFTVAWTVEENGVNGTLKVGRQPEQPFTSHVAFGQLMDSFMLDHLRLRSYRTWKKNPGGGDDDGTTGEHGWTSQFHALLVRGEKIKVILGEHTGDGQAQMLLQIFLGLPWAYTSKAATAALGAEKAKFSASRRRATADQKARKNNVEPDRQRLKKIGEELGRLAASGAVAPEEIDRRLAAFALASRTLAEATAQYGSYRRDVVVLSREADEAAKRLAADREDQVIVSLIGRVKPTACPRCSTAISEERIAHEAERHACSVCDEDLGDGTAISSAKPELTERAEVAAQVLSTGEEKLDELKREMDAASARRAEARTTLQAVLNRAPNQAAVRALEIEQATLRGRVQALGEAPAAADLEEPLTLRVAATAKELADDLRKEASGTLLTELGEEIVTIARAFGIDGIEEARPDLGAHLGITINGQKANYSGRADGEQLRLKLALIIGLLRVSERLGVGRHPGLLLVDSPFEQEMQEADIRRVLEELQRICDETGLQIILATARHAEVRDLVPEERIIHSEDWDAVW